jgi:hypothetical protein
MLLLNDLLKKLLNEVDMGHDHAPAAVSLAAELIHGITTDKL